MNPKTVSKGRLVVYLILGPTAKIYVGKTKSAYHRCYQYNRAFKKRSTDHINNHLMNSMIKYGFDSFQMIDWEFCDTQNHLSERELYWMDFFNSTDRKIGYNIRRDSRDGMLTHPETSLKITNNLKRQWANGDRDDHGLKLAKSWSTDPLRRAAQSKTMTRNLTKYEYIIYIDEKILTINYKMLSALGFKNVLAEFHRRKSNKVTHKGYEIERVVINEKT